MRIPFVTFLPLEKELDHALREAFERVYTRSWYIRGAEDEAFERAFAQYCGAQYCVGVGNGLDNHTITMYRVFGGRKRIW